MKIIFLMFVGFMTCSTWANSVLADPVPTPRPQWDFSDVAHLPVQAGGRVKPLESYARDIVLYITGSKKFSGWRSLELIFSWMVEPKYWESQPVIKIANLEAKRQLGLDEGRSLFSFEELRSRSYLGQYAQEISRPGAAMPGAKLSAREKELRSALDRLSLFRGIVSGESWPLIPPPLATPQEHWKPIAAPGEKELGKDGDLIRAQFYHLVVSYQKADRELFEKSAKSLRTVIEISIPNWNEGAEKKLQAEVLYTDMQPFLWAWILYFLSALGFWMILWLRTEKWIQGAGLNLLAFGSGIGAVAVHVFGFVLRCYVAGRPPVTNMYESIIWVSFGVIVFASILYAIHRQAILYAVACSLTALALMAADSAPTFLDPAINPLVPVLRSNFWLTIHVLTITLSYAAFTLTLGLADATLFQFWKGGAGAPAKIASLNQLTYRAMQFGVVLVAAGTILGGVWADYSWGRFWGWDPKEVWALIVLLTYIIILHGRMTGWVGQFGFPAWTVAGFLSVLMAWYGVNFVLGVGLHSYGFSSGGQFWVGLFSLLQLVFVGAVAAAHQCSKKA